MLVLSRKVGEKIVVGDNIVVTVLEMKGRAIRLGIEAPTNVPVWRGEIVEFHDLHVDADEPELVGAH